jgi:hypothetical protein
MLKVPKTGNKKIIPVFAFTDGSLVRYNRLFGINSPINSDPIYSKIAGG